MFEVFNGLKQQVKNLGTNKPEVNSKIFLFMRFCMLTTLLACVLVTAKTFIGDNINCLTGFEKIELKKKYPYKKFEADAIETYCFISSTFTLANLEGDTAHPGVGPNVKEADAIYHAYYQWVPIVLAFQAAIFYLPIWLWGVLDKGLFREMLCQLDKVHLDDITPNIQSSAQYFAKSLRTHRLYALSFLACEILALGIAVGNLFFTNAFLGGEFFGFGLDALRYLGQSPSDPNNPLNYVFPKVTKCTWHKFGPSGTIQKYDAMCVLPLNIVNEKTYIVLWMVYMITTVKMAVFLLFHLIILLAPNLRNAILVYLTPKQQTKVDLQHILTKSNYGDWFLIYHFRNHMVYFKEWVAEVREILNE